LHTLVRVKKSEEAARHRIKGGSARPVIPTRPGRWLHAYRLRENTRLGKAATLAGGQQHRGKATTTKPGPPLDQRKREDRRTMGGTRGRCTRKCRQRAGPTARPPGVPMNRRESEEQEPPTATGSELYKLYKPISCTGLGGAPQLDAEIAQPQTRTHHPDRGGTALFPEPAGVPVARGLLQRVFPPPLQRPPGHQKQGPKNRGKGRGGPRQGQHRIQKGTPQQESN
jgi:hypothetical protein